MAVRVAGRMGVSDTGSDTKCGSDNELVGVTVTMGVNGSDGGSGTKK